jgi:hypothetical protein
VSRKPQAEADVVRAQISPAAHEILGLVGVEVERGFRKDRKGVERPAWGPRFRGVPEEKWAELLARFPKAFWELVAICESDFPTWSALLAKVAPKGGGEPHPFIFNTPQRVVWENGICYCLENDLPLWLIILKARQFGVTTFVALWQYWQEWRKKNVHGLFLGDKVDLLARQLNIVRTCHEGLPKVGGIRPALRSDTKSQGGKVPKYELYMAERGGVPWNSGGTTAPATKQNVALGAQSTHVTGSEAAFWGGDGGLLQDILDALLPQLPGPSSPNYLGGASSMIVESTPQGMNDFRDLYWDAKEVGEANDRTWVTVFLPWFIFEEGYFEEVPPGFVLSEEDKAEWKILTELRLAYDGRPVTSEQMYWRYKMIRDKYKSAEVFNEWYPRDDETCFRAADGSVFKDDATYLEDCLRAAEADAKKLLPAAGLMYAIGGARGDLRFDPVPAPFYYEIHALTGAERRESKWAPNPKGKIWIWEPPQRGHSYTIGADTSGGTGNDGACAHICCVTCGCQAGEMWSRYLDPSEFTDASVHLGWWYNTAIINPEINHLGAAMLKRLIFEWNYPNVARDEAWDEARFKERKFGFSTTQNTKPVMISYMRNLIQQRHYRIASARLRREMSRFYYLGLTSRDEEKYAGGRTGKGADDTVLACGLALWAVRQAPPGARADFETRFARIPNAVDLGLNRTAGEGLYHGKGLSCDQYGEYDLPESISNLFEAGLDEQLVASCPLGGAWGGYGLEL